jgi:hypothetical protein
VWYEQKHHEQNSFDEPQLWFPAGAELNAHSVNSRFWSTQRLDIKETQMPRLEMLISRLQKPLILVLLWAFTDHQGFINRRGEFVLLQQKRLF